MKTASCASSPPAVSDSLFFLDPNQPVVNPETLAQLRQMMPEEGVQQIYAAVVRPRSAHAATA